MTDLINKEYTAFAGEHIIASGDIALLAARVKKTLDNDSNAQILIFDDTTSEQIELDLRGTVEDVLKRLSARTEKMSEAPEPEQSDHAEPRGPGRPKLGVIAREVTLLPRHWEWLNTQPGGASVALRKLVEKAKRDNVGEDQIRQARESSYKFMSVMAGDRINFEEAARALFAGEQARFNSLIEPWPRDIQAHIKKISSKAFRAPFEA